MGVRVVLSADGSGWELAAFDGPTEWGPEPTGRRGGTVTLLRLAAMGSCCRENRPLNRLKFDVALSGSGPCHPYS